VPAAIKILGPDDAPLFQGIAPGVFDREINSRYCAEFLADPRHHLAVAVEDQTVVAFASGVHYVHPDKPPELWINEVSVAASHQNHGLGKQLLRALLDLGRSLGCVQAWVLTDRDNLPAMKLYASAGGVEFPRDQVMFEFELARNFAINDE
jgi:GNAT superfamily N-acetyltransferase